jgi:hypothetical protein
MLDCAEEPGFASKMGIVFLLRQGMGALAIILIQIVSYSRRRYS